MNDRFGLVYRLALAISTAGIVLSLSATPACGGQARGASQAPEAKASEAKSKESEVKKVPREIASAAAAPGIGGMALISADMYLVVHDTKARRSARRRRTGGDLAIASDDENYGAAWRPVALPKPVAKTKM